MNKRYKKGRKNQGLGRNNQSPPNIKPDFSDKKLTNYGGLLVFARLLKKLKFKELIQKHFYVERGKNIQYTVDDFISMIIAGILAGAEHMNQVAAICKDTVLQTMFAWTGGPDESTLGRFTDLLGWKHQNQIVRIMDKIREKVWEKRWLGRAELDLDSTPKTKYGNQEAAAKGFNPHKQGAKSINPLLCFIAGTKEVLNAWLRKGNAYTGDGAIQFTKECIAKLPKRVWRIFIRADSGFFNGKYLDYLESFKSQYIIKVKLKNLRDVLTDKGLKWRKARKSGGYETTSFTYQCGNWDRSRRFVAVRETKEIKEEGQLFPVVVYKYSCYVTNLRSSPMAIHRKYGKRATSENWIDELKSQCGVGSFTKQSFWSSAFILQLTILAYNLKIWLTWLTDKRSWKEEVKTFRFWFIKMAGNLVNNSGRLRLKMQEGNFFEFRWMRIFNTIACLEFP